MTEEQEYEASRPGAGAGVLEGPTRPPAVYARPVRIG